jgi:hypothetical protein
MLSFLALLFCLAGQCSGPCTVDDDCPAACACFRPDGDVGQCIPPHAIPQPKGTRMYSPVGGSSPGITPNLSRKRSISFS